LQDKSINNALQQLHRDAMNGLCSGPEQILALTEPRGAEPAYKCPSPTGAASVSDRSHALVGSKEVIAPAFKHSKQSAFAGLFIDGLLSCADRKTGWMLAQEAGLARPGRIQSLPGRSS
jgi:hypothetical protein